MVQTLDESRLIELAQMVDLIQDDESFLEEMCEEAGLGEPGGYETFRLRMAKYNLAAARQYLEWIVDQALGLKDIADVTIVDPKNGVVVFEGENPVVPKSKDPLSKLHVPKAPWTPSWKNENKIKTVIEEILQDVTEEARTVDGFKGWLAASATAALDGKPDIKVVLKTINEVLDGKA